MKKLISDLRKKFNCSTQRELAKKLLIPEETLSRWRKGDIPRSSKNLIRLILNSQSDLQNDTDTFLD